VSIGRLSGVEALWDCGTVFPVSVVAGAAGDGGGVLMGAVPALSW